MVEGYGNSLDVVREELKQNEHTENTAIYSLLLKKFIKEGGSSIADPLS